MQYAIAEKNVCNKITLYQVLPRAKTYTGTWYLNSNVDAEKKIRINQEISQLRMDGIIQEKREKFLTEHVPKTCGQGDTPGIDGEVLGPLFGALLSPFAFGILVSLCIRAQAQYYLRRLYLRRMQLKKGIIVVHDHN